MRHESFKTQIPEIRNLIEEKFGQFEIGQEGDRSQASRYIGIHLDERDGLFKQWFSSSPQALKINNEYNGAYCRASLSTTFHGACHLLKTMSAISPQLPPLELPSTEQLRFIAERLPHMLDLSYYIPNEAVATSSNEQSRSSRKQDVILFNPSSQRFFVRNELPTDEIGFILPVYSRPILGLDN